jgi:glutamate-1-semialdehyde 2,1-aminomutase
MTWTNKQDQALRERAQSVIPNGMYGHQSVFLMPDSFPQFFQKAEGTYLWDTDGNRYIDYMCAYGPNLLGYGQETIDAAYVNQMRKGDTMTGPAEAMVTFAEAMVAQVTHADWAMFCKNGTDATTMAVMVARNQTRRKTIVIAKGAYHGAAPWCTPLLSGVTQADRAHQIFYEYNDVESLEAAVKAAGGDLAAIIASPFKHDTFVDQAAPTEAYALAARRLCDTHDALLIIDDVRAGFRLARDCSWATVGVQPDLSTWGKCIANGHPISALLGNDRARVAAAMIYVTGSYWFSAAPMAAGVETLRLIRETNYLEHTQALAEQLRSSLASLALTHGFALRQTGPAAMPLILFEEDPDLAKGYFWTDALIQRGVYFHPFHNMFFNAAMTKTDVEVTLNACDDAFKALKAAGKISAPSKLEFLYSIVSTQAAL